jgi:hypothetical protein
MSLKSSSETFMGVNPDLVRRFLEFDRLAVGRSLDL